jgi:hypothetical protein
LRLGVEKELTPEWLEFLRNLVHARQTVGSQRSSHLANPSSNVITSHRKAGARAEERLASELVVDTGGGQVKKELVAVCKKELARIINTERTEMYVGSRGWHTTQYSSQLEYAPGR